MSDMVEQKKETASPDWRDALKARFDPKQPFKQVTIGDGWKKLVLELTKKLDALKIKFTIGQIKEKFGGLRYYAQIDDQDVAEEVLEKFIGLIDDAEAASFDICEDCGEPGFRASPWGWISTLCERCWRKNVATKTRDDLMSALRRVVACKVHAIAGCECNIEDVRDEVRRVETVLKDFEIAIAKHQTEKDPETLKEAR